MYVFLYSDLIKEKVGIRLILIERLFNVFFEDVVND
jgi:hypothetical protein